MLERQLRQVTEDLKQANQYVSQLERNQNSQSSAQGIIRKQSDPRSFTNRPQATSGY